MPELVTTEEEVDIMEVLQGFNQRVAALKKNWKNKNATAAQVSTELLQTFAPVMKDLLALVARLDENVDRLEENAEYTDDRLRELEQDAPVDSQLTPEDAAKLTAALQAALDFVPAAAARLGEGRPPTVGNAVESLISQLKDCLVLIEGITLEEEPPEDEPVAASGGTPFHDEIHAEEVEADEPVDQPALEPN